MNEPRPPRTDAATRRPTRSCVGCGQRAASEELIRFVVDPDGGVVADLGHKSFGRGVWAHPRLDCLTKAAKSGFSRSLKGAFPLVPEQLLDAVGLAAARRIRGLLVAAIGSRAILKGNDSVRDAGDRVRLVVLAEDARAAAQSAWLQEFVDRGRCVVWGTKAQLGDFFGREEVAVLGLCDAGIAKALLTAIGVARLATAERVPDARLSEVQ